MQQKFRNIRLYPLDKSMERNWFIKYQVADYKQGKWVWKQYSGCINLHTTVDGRTKEAMRCINSLHGGIEPVKMPGARTIPAPDAPRSFANTIQLLREYLDNKPYVSANTVSNYRSKVKKLHKWLDSTGAAALPIGQFSAQYVLRFVGWLSKSEGYSNTTCNKYKAVLGALWGDMIIDGIIDVNPWQHVRSLRKDSVPFKTYPQTLQKYIRTTLPKHNEQLYMAAMAVYYDFIRPAELRRLRLFNIEWERQCFRITADISKSKNDRMIIIPDDLFAMLLSKGYNKMPPSYYLFTKDGIPGDVQIGKNWFNRMFFEYRQQYNIPADYKFYGLKHTGNSRLGVSGISPQLQQKHNRHKDLKSIEPYNSGISYEDMHFMRKLFPRFGDSLEALNRNNGIESISSDLQEIKRAIDELKRAKSIDNGNSIIDFIDKDYEA
jgi:site-specific recombinase XerD